MGRHQTPLKVVVIYIPTPDWEERVHRAFDIILANGVRRRMEAEKLALEVHDDEQLQESVGGRHD